MKRGDIMKTNILIPVLILLFGALLFAQNTQDAVRIQQDELGFGTRDLAMGGTGVSSATDYSAIYWNPAGLALVENSQFSGEFSYLRFSNRATFAENLSDMSSSYNRLNALGVAIPFPTTRGSLVFAFGYNFVKSFDDYLYFNGFNTNSNALAFNLADENGISDTYYFDQDVTQTEEVSTEGGLHQWSFGGAMALSPSFDMGISMNFWRGSENYRLRFQQEDTEDYYYAYPANFDTYTLNQNLDSRYSAFSLKIGGMIKMNRFSRIGLAVEFPTTFTVTENYSSNDEITFDDGYADPYDYEPGTWDYRVRTPFRFDAGVTVGGPGLSASAAITYRDWTQTRFEKPNNYQSGSDYDELLAQNLLFNQDYRETVNYRLGGEFTFPGSGTSLRAGYAVFPSPLKGATSDLDKKYYSAGIGVKIAPNSRLDFTYVHSGWKRASEDSYTPGGTLEDISANRIFLGINYAF